MLGGALFSAPWETLSVVAIVYLALIPFSIAALCAGSGGSAPRLRAAPQPAGAAPAPLPAGRPARRRRSPPNAPSE